MPSPLILLVEDEALIALALMDDLEAAGYRVAGPFHRCKDSLEWLSGETPDMAIIDIHLRDGSSADLACALRDRDIPFVVFSGDKRDGRVPEAFEGARWLSKPVAVRRLLETLDELVAIVTNRPRIDSTGLTALAI
jgi:DNA-binding response OmpR family regulator